MFFAAQQTALAERQRQLRQRSAQLRQRLAGAAQVLQRPLALADQVRHGWQWLRAHPEVLAGGALLLALLRPRRAWRLARRAWVGWQLWRRLQGLQSRWDAGQAAPPGGRGRPLR